MHSRLERDSQMSGPQTRSSLVVSEHVPLFISGDSNMVVSERGRRWTASKPLSLPSHSEAGSSDIILRNNVL